jgi:hypothetical protein
MVFSHVLQLLLDDSGSSCVSGFLFREKITTMVMAAITRMAINHDDILPAPLYLFDELRLTLSYSVISSLEPFFTKNKRSYHLLCNWYSMV